MIKRDITIDGKTYTIRSSTSMGIEHAIAALKRSVKELKKQKKQEDNDGI